MIAVGASRDHGFTLLEVLVALLVLSVGLLGLAGLQTFSLKNNNGALMRSQAVALAYDALDLMRGNRDAALKGSASWYQTNFSDDDVETVACSPCSSDDQAQNDIAAWKQSIVTLDLPRGEGQIEIADVAGGDAVKVTVRVRWDDDRDGNNDGVNEVVFVESLL